MYLSSIHFDFISCSSSSTSTSVTPIMVANYARTQRKYKSPHLQYSISSLPDYPGDDLGRLLIYEIIFLRIPSMLNSNHSLSTNQWLSTTSVLPQALSTLPLCSWHQSPYFLFQHHFLGLTQILGLWAFFNRLYLHYKFLSIPPEQSVFLQYNLPKSLHTPLATRWVFTGLPEPFLTSF